MIDFTELNKIYEKGSYDMYRRLGTITTRKKHQRTKPKCKITKTENCLCCNPKVLHINKNLTIK
jgi:hypothetical protein